MPSGFFIGYTLGNPDGGTMSENNQTNSKGRGGARKGAGRKTGSATTKTREIADKAAAGGITPLEYMLEVMRKDIGNVEPDTMWKAIAMKFEAAKAAAPYIHPRLAAVEHTGPEGGDIGVSFRWAE